MSIPVCNITRSESCLTRVYAGLDTGRLKDNLHLHDYIQIWYTRRSSYLCDAGGMEYRPTEGCLMVIPPSLYHALDTRASENIELLVCEFKPDILATDACPRAQEMYLAPLIRAQQAGLCKLKEQDAVRADSILSEIQQEYASHDRSSAFYIRARIVELVSLIVAEYSKSGLVDDARYGEYRGPFFNVLTYIGDNYTRPIRLADMAKIACMSERSFTRFFHEILGMSPMEYIILLRVKRAKGLLSSTNRILLDVAENCGFSNPAHFHRLFKQFTGLSPGEYRKSHKNTQNRY